MSSIGGIDISSGGHVWIWSSPSVVRKDTVSAGVRGAYGMVTAVAPRRGVIAGRDGGEAVLRAESDAALTSIEEAIEEAIRSGAELSWSDDQGRSGSALVLLEYRRQGPRRHTASQVWQYYTLLFQEMNG
jgi:hypothetical protein